jgi:hypothetical protein
MRVPIACFGLLDDAAIVLAVALLVLAVGWALRGAEFEVELLPPDPPERKP